MNYAKKYDIIVDVNKNMGRIGVFLRYLYTLHKKLPLFL